LTFILAGYVIFLAAFSLFMHRESRKHGDNQYRIKLLPPPVGWRPKHQTVQSEAVLADPQN